MGNLITRPPDATTVDSSGVRVTGALLDRVAGKTPPRDDRTRGRAAEPARAQRPPVR